MKKDQKTKEQLLIEIVSLNKSITETKKSEKKFKHKEKTILKELNKLKVLYNNAHDAIITHDLKGKIVEVNNKMLEMYKVTPDQALSLSIIDISAPDMSMEVAGKHWQKVLRGEDNIFEWHAKRPNDNSLFFVEVTHKRIRVDNKDFILGNIRDITKAKLAEKEISKYKDHLEKLVKKRTKELEQQRKELELQNKELERLNSLFVNREFRIKELRDEVKELKQKQSPDNNLN